MAENRCLKELIETKGAWTFDLLRKALDDGREKNLNEIKESGLRGRGGAAFPTYIKWKSVMDKDDVVLVCNADEGEPGTFKDRYIMETNPDLLLESILICAYTIGAKQVFIYIRGEYVQSRERMEEALLRSARALDMYRQEAGHLPEIKIVMGGGAYVCGDETSLINSLEGKRPSPRIKPPLPVEKGYLGKPTVVNNVETLVNVPLIIRDGGTAYARLGVENSTGTKLISLSGKVNRPGVYEVEMGHMSVREIIEELGGGVREGRRLKFVIPGGISTPLLTEDELDVLVDIDSLANAGTSLGSGAMIVADDTVDAYQAALTVADFFMSETCGTCFPCKEGNRQVYHLLTLIDGDKKEERYLDLIDQVTKTTSLAARCGLGKSTGDFITSSIHKIPEDYLARIHR